MVDIYAGSELALGEAAVPVIAKSGKAARAPAMVLIRPDGSAIDTERQDNLSLIKANVVAPAQKVKGGDYYWTVVGTFNGASVQLQALGPDEQTWLNIGPAKTASDTTATAGVGIGCNAIVRASVTGGAPSGLFASLNLVP
ncbi:hypothetical protein [Sphingomonas sanguinis]|uniref:hypothetical protein n=1 Tax=Sphingomonas sanguinis TaxID=33051 RepID=UPI00077BC92D|nr:hypothetical protein [Sphingomonas sanguinis]